jgi:RecB family endonuclease NucS
MTKTILSEEQKAQVVNFIKTKPEMNSKEIASILNYPVECVRSLKSHVTMGTYDKAIIDDDSEIDYEISLSMEKDLQTFLLNDLSQIEPGLKLVEKGKEYQIEVGRIDILAKDKNDKYVIIELKAGKAKDDALGQLLGYMGFVSETLANGKPVRGYIIANDFEERLKYAVKNIPDVKLKAYKVNFSFVDINR